MRETFASYSPSQFALDVSNLGLTTEPGTQHLASEILPVFVHEYCHYLQDVTTVSGIFGFYLWMCDVVGLTQVFAQGEGKTKIIPLATSYGQMRRFYLIYCGTGRLEVDLPYDQLQIERIDFAVETVPLTSGPRQIARNTVVFSNRLVNDYHFGLMPLQEIHAFYAQQYREIVLPGVEFRVPVTSLLTLPYHLGDLLFAHFGITADVACKFLLTGLTLDSIQAPTVFLKTLEALANRTLKWETDEQLIYATVNRIDKAHAHDKDAFMQAMLADLRTWSQDTQRTYLSRALTWYLSVIEMAAELKKIRPIYFFYALLMQPANLGMMVSILPPPILLNSGKTERYHDESNATEDQRYEEAFQAAGTIRNHWMLYNILTARTVDEINKKCSCPLFEDCEIKQVLKQEYTCKTAPWLIVKENSEVVCPYGMATHSFGLWQNELEIQDGN